MSDKPPRDRNIAMVFQNYALYPHMNVYDNIAFALKLRNLPNDEIDRKVKEAAEILGITSYLQRKPRELSGGQRQRVALGRSIVREPEVFLMDEPLSNLGAKLRVQMRAEIAKLQARLGITTIYVTHDQVEAMTMADRIIVMKDGVIQQVADPQTLYDQPANQFVASFIGTPPMNFIACKLQKQQDGFHFISESVDVIAPAQWSEKIAAYDGQEVTLGVRPENMCPSSLEKDQASAIVDLVEVLGSETLVNVKIGADSAIIKAAPDYKPAVGEAVQLHFDMEKAHLFNKETGVVIV
ncbi:MAG TPA: glycerol-3-phosphate ABC transporter ATP-binding protein [Sporomusaceae bacterium]|nr:glycerol-3-phosphate ABC transporter ATP-binding protein [Sporomusaceae bacterium]